MGGHVAAAVVDKQAGHIFAQWVLNPTLRIARFIRYQSPGSEQARFRLGLSDVWRRDHRIPTPLTTAFICESQADPILASNDPSSATRPEGRVNCNRSAMAGFAAAH